MLTDTHCALLLFGSGPLIGWPTDHRFSVTETHGLNEKPNKHTASQRYDGKWSDYISSVAHPIALITGLNNKEVQALAGFY